MIIRIWKELEKYGYRRIVMMRENGMLTINGIYLHNNSEHVKLVGILTTLPGYEGCISNTEEVHYHFSDGAERYCIIAEWNI